MQCGTYGAKRATVSLEPADDAGVLASGEEPAREEHAVQDGQGEGEAGEHHATVPGFKHA